MKKSVLIFICLFLAICLYSMPVCAQEQYDSYYDDNVDKIVSEYSIEFNRLKDNPFEYLFSVVKDALKSGTSNSLDIYIQIAVIVIASSMINFLSVNQSVSIHKFINVISVFVIFTNTFAYIMQILTEATDMFCNVKNFMISFLPVFAGLSFASGEMITSTVYTGFFLVSIITVANFCINYIIPSLNLFLTIGITSSVTSVINLKPICDFYSKAIKTAMTASVSVLCFVLSLQTTITQGQDNLAIKTGKMLVTSAVPIIGSTLQGTIGSVYASMGILKSFCGLAGIAVIISLSLPFIIKLTIIWLLFCALNVLCEMFENETASKIIIVFKEIIAIILSMSVLFMILLLFSVSIMIKVFQGV